MDETKPQNLIQTWLPRLMVGVIIIALLGSFFRHFNSDELEGIHTAWKILQGEKIYIDFFQHHHPFFYYTLIPIIFIFGDSLITLIVARLLVFIIFLLILFVSYNIAAKAFNKDVAWISILLLSTTVIFLDKVIEIRPDVPQTLFGLISILFLLTYYERRRGCPKAPPECHSEGRRPTRLPACHRLTGTVESRGVSLMLRDAIDRCAPSSMTLRNLRTVSWQDKKYLVFSAISLGISFLFLQKTVFLILLIGGMLIFDAYKKHLSWNDALIYGTAFGLSISPYYLYLLATNSLWPYITFNWILNMRFLHHFSFMRWVYYTLAINTTLCIFYIIGLIFFLKTPLQKRIGFFSIGFLVSVMFVRLPFRQYFMMAIPFIAAVAGYAIYMVCKKNKCLFVLIMIIATFIGLFSFIGSLIYYPNNEQLAEIAYVTSITKSTDCVYDASYLYRKDLDYFWFSLGPTGALETYKTFAEYHYDIYELIDEKRPKVIINHLIDNMQDKRIADHYAPSKIYDDIFIRKE